MKDTNREQFKITILHKLPSQIISSSLHQCFEIAQKKQPHDLSKNSTKWNAALLGNTSFSWHINSKLFFNLCNPPTPLHPTPRTNHTTTI